MMNKLWHALFHPKPRNASYRGAYSLVRLVSGEVGIHCYDCKRTSFHPKDVENRYCGCCHKFFTHGLPFEWL